MKNYNIKTKADAMAFAIINANGDLDKAMQIYNMFVNNTDLVDKNHYKKSNKHSFSTIILSTLSHLEWMTENLSGYGGTEIDGRTYYTYDEAKEAVKQLGNGWRLPTHREMVDLCNLGSTWDDERKGRWFGGNHETDHKGSLFFPATGYRSNASGALTNVGSNGNYWSSSPNSSSSTNAGHLNFNSTGVNPRNNNNRAHGFSVRCVRNIK